MSKIWMPGGGGGGDGSDDCTLTLADVPQGLTAVTADSDDDAKAGTLDAAASAADSQVLAGESYMKFNQEAKHWEKRQGGLKNNGAVNLALNCGESRQIPGGFTTGGTVRANSLASQTLGTATADQILEGRSAWVNGSRVDGVRPKSNVVEYTKSVIVQPTTWNILFNQPLTAGLYIINQSLFTPYGCSGLSLSMECAGKQEQQTDRALNNPCVRGVTGITIWHLPNDGNYIGSVYVNHSTTVTVNSNLRILKLW